MRYVTLLLLLSGAVAAQTPKWWNPDQRQYFKQFRFPEIKGAVADTPRKCAIPLVNVLKKDPTNDRMVVQVPKSNQPSPFVVPPPMPACEAGK